MSFPINSTSVMTDPCERVCRVMQRSKVGSGKSRIISYAGIFSCRRIDGSSSWSQHAWGNASDLFPVGKEYGVKRARCYAIANAVVYQATHKTVANRGRKIPVAECIDHENRRIWTPAGGWRPYGGNTGL